RLQVQIAGLKQKRDSLILELQNLKKEYEEGHDAAMDFYTESQGLQETYDKYEDVLIDEGVEDKAQMIQNPEYAEGEDVVKYHEKGRVLRNKTKAIKSSKAKIKEEVPDLNFRGGKTSGEEESPRNISYKKIEDEIARIDEQIERLEEKTPERIERAEKADACTKQIEEDLKQKNQFPFRLNIQGLGASFVRRSNLDFAGSSSLINTFGVDALEDSLKALIPKELDKVIEVIDTRRYSQEDLEHLRQQMLDAMLTKLDADLAKVRIDEFLKEHPEGREIERESRDINKDIENNADESIAMATQTKKELGRSLDKKYLLGLHINMYMVREKPSQHFL
ncbi:MAG: hypothetical protein WCO09_03130, partial [bacterium]